MNTFDLTLISDIILWSMPIPLTLFILLYTLKFPWRNSVIGPMLLGQKWIFLSFVLFLSISRIAQRMEGMTEVDAYPGQPLLRIIMYAFVASSFWAFTIILFRMYHQNKKETLTSLQGEENDYNP